MKGVQDVGSIPTGSTIRKLMIKKPSKLQLEIVSWLILAEMMLIVGFFSWLFYNLVSL